MVRKEKKARTTYATKCKFVVLKYCFEEETSIINRAARLANHKRSNLTTFDPTVTHKDPTSRTRHLDFLFL